MSINRVILLGRITHDLELKQTPKGTSVLSFTVALNRNYVKQGEERQADFITCVAWDKTAEFVAKFFEKGKAIALEGNLRTRSYEDKNKSKHTVTEVFVDAVSFAGDAKRQEKQQEQSEPEQPQMADYGAMLNDAGVPL